MGLFNSISIVIILSAFLGGIAVLFRQPLVVAYIFGGILLGPWGFAIIGDVEVLSYLSHIGITLLLFLAGLDLMPERFFKQMMRQFPVVLFTCATNAIILGIGGYLAGYPISESIWMGLALMFSSTLLFIKLTPFENIAQQKIHTFCIAILIIQDILAILILAALSINPETGGSDWTVWLWLPLAGTLAIAITFFGEQYVLRPIMIALRGSQEVYLLSALAWCLAMAILYKTIGFSHEIGAFFAGMSLSRSPLCENIEINLLFPRDFFLVLFFFSLGAEIDLFMTQKLVLPTVLLTLLLILSRGPILRFFFRWSAESPPVQKESAIRLAQGSEFGLIVSMLAEKQGVITTEVSQLIQLIVIFSFIISASRIFYLHLRKDYDVNISVEIKE